MLLARFFRQWFRRLALGMVLSAFALPAGAEETPLGPLYHQFKLTLDSGHRTEVAGPLYYHEEIADEWEQLRTWAAPPIFSYGLDEDLDREFFDFAWKGLTYRRYGDEWRFQILQLFSFAGGGTQVDTNVHRFTLFPLLFIQRSPIAEKNYTALVPFYGHLQGRLFKERSFFVMFPIYGQTQRRDVVTDNYLYPVFHLRHGHGLSGWQFWPLVGRESKELTWSTNKWGEGEPVAGHKKTFVLWPFFGDARTGLGTTNSAHEQYCIPFYSYLRSPMRDSTSYLWPLGVTITDDREKKFHELGVPWPLIVFARGPGKNTDRVWPFYSKATNANSTSDWMLWPVYKHNRLYNPPLDRERTRILFFLYSDTVVRNLEQRTSARQIDLWPLFTSKRTQDNKRRLQILAPLEPYLPNNPSVERNLSPLWSIWRSESNPAQKATSQSLLWNLYRRDTRDESRKCSLLFGLFQYHSGPDGRGWRLFYVPFGRGKPGKDTASH